MTSGKIISSIINNKGIYGPQSSGGKNSIIPLNFESGENTASGGEAGTGSNNKNQKNSSNSYGSSGGEEENPYEK